MRKQYNAEQDEPRLRAVTQEISGIINGPLYDNLKELFEDIYGGTCDEEYKMILKKLVLIEQEDLPVAEMRYKGIGDF